MYGIINGISIIMRVTNSCNLNCKYCYSPTDKLFQNIKLVEKIFLSIIPFYKKINFIWHGGEALLLPVEFYEQCFKLQEEINKKHNHIVINGLQTNGVLLNNDYISLFNKYNVRIGFSFDGINNDITRGSSKIIINNYNNMKLQGIDSGFLYVLSKANINLIIDDYKYFNENGYSYKINRIFGMGRAEDNNSLLLSNEEYISKMKELCDYWFWDNNCKISVEPFEEYIEMYKNNRCSSCMYGNCLFLNLCIDINGDIYPCSRLIDEEFFLGNINNISNIRSVFVTNTYNKLILKTIERKNKCKNFCNLYKYCASGCTSDVYLNGDLNEINKEYCLEFRSIFEHLVSLLNKIDDLREVNPRILKIISK